MTVLSRPFDSPTEESTIQQLFPDVLKVCTPNRKTSAAAAAAVAQRWLCRVVQVAEFAKWSDAYDAKQFYQLNNASLVVAHSLYNNFEHSQNSTFVVGTYVLIMMQGIFRKGKILKKTKSGWISEEVQYAVKIGPSFNSGCRMEYFDANEWDAMVADALIKIDKYPLHAQYYDQKARVM